MSFPRYPEYKPSGVESLGEVPDGWRVLSLKRVVNPVRQITYGIVQAGPHVLDGVPYIRPADMTAEDGIKAPDEIMRTSDDIAANYTRSTIRTGDIVCSIGPSFGKVMITPAWLDGANLTQGTARIAVQREHNSRYIFWTLRAPASVGQWVSSIGGATFSALNLGPLARTTILVPPLPEQTAIAEFLDRETGKIDGLVAEQRRLVELLKEKRQAVISHAVTKGLNPHAPMKPSGIEWLGEVPEHWGIWKLTHAFGKIGSGTTPKTDNREYYDEGTHPWVNTGDLNDGDLIDCEKKITDKALTDHTTLRIYPAGSVLIAMYGATIGKLAILQFPASVNQACCVFSGQLKIDYKFLFFWLLGYRPQIISLASGGGQPNVNQDILRGLRVACPELPEQTAIVEFLGTELAKFDTLTAEAQRAIDLLQERRAALISAAVTGQIDVRQQVRN